MEFRFISEDFPLKTYRSSIKRTAGIPWMEINGTLTIDPTASLTLSAQGEAEYGESRWFYPTVTCLTIVEGPHSESAPRTGVADEEARRLFVAELVRVRDLLTSAIERYAAPQRG
jgi:hypothetical protein